MLVSDLNHHVRKKGMSVTKQVYQRSDTIVEVVRPMKDKGSRITWMYFVNQNAAQQWISRGAVDGNEVVRKRQIRYRLPEQKIIISRKRNAFVVEPTLTKVKGITSTLSLAFGNLFSPHFNGKRYTKAKRGKKEMQVLGMSVDKELKLFATGDIEYSSAKHIETKQIIYHLASKGISLITSGVLVSNFLVDKPDANYSGTEIDLVGYDHRQKSFVIIEVKVTGKKLSHMKESNKSASILKSCGFRKSEMGRYAAQLACTSLMYGNTYVGDNFYPMLVICESDASQCDSFTLDASLIDSSRFKMIDGY